MFKILLEWSKLAHETTYFEYILFKATCRELCSGSGLLAIIP
jgi:hypothetical protein